MAKQSAAVEHALSVIAHVAMATDMSKKVAGMKGFRTFYVNQLSANDKAILRRFEELTKQAYADAVKMLEKDQGNG